MALKGGFNPLYQIGGPRAIQLGFGFNSEERTSVCKRKDSVYSSRRRWLKVKNPNYTQAEGRREMFEKFRES